MIKFLILLSCFLLKFASITPYSFDASTYNDYTILDMLANNGYDFSSNYLCTWVQGNHCYCIVDMLDQSVPTFTSYAVDDSQSVIGYTQSLYQSPTQNFRIYHINIYGSDVYSWDLTSDSYSFGFAATSSTSNRILTALNPKYLPFSVNGVDFVIQEVPTVPRPDISLVGQHMEFFNNGSSSSTRPPYSSFNRPTLSGDTVQTSSNPPSTLDQSNPEHWILLHIMNNTSGALEGLSAINNNIISSFENMYNGLSGLMSGFFGGVGSYFVYMFEPINNDAIEPYIQDICFVSLASTVTDTSDHISSTINNYTDLNTLSFDVDLRNTIFDDCGVLVVDMSFLQDSKTIWQPLLLALIYGTLLITIIRSIPAIIRGVKGGSDNAN